MCTEAISGDHPKQKIDSILLKREAFWCAQLFTLQPHGLSKRQEYKSKRIPYN